MQYIEQFSLIPVGVEALSFLIKMCLGSKALGGAVTFGHTKVPLDHIFYHSRYSFACVNISPFKKHHVLLCPFEQKAKLADLSFSSVQKVLSDLQIVSKVMNGVTNDILNIFLQNGKEAGQTIPHIHFHLIPEHLEPIDNHRAYKRPFDEMKAEAERYRRFIEINFPDFCK